MLIMFLFLLNVNYKYKTRINLVTNLPIEPLPNLRECVQVSIDNGKFYSIKINVILITF